MSLGDEKRTNTSPREFKTFMKRLGVSAIFLYEIRSDLPAASSKECQSNKQDTINFLSYRNRIKISRVDEHPG